jgi:apolipoprotein N-acyltransferase
MFDMATQETTPLKKIISFSARRPRATLALCGLLAGGVFSWQLIPLFLPFLLLPLYYFFLSPKKPLQLKSSLLLGLSFFIPFHGAVLSWFLDADISGLAGLSPEVELLTSTISLFLMVGVTTLAMLPLIVALHFSHRLALKRPLLALITIAAMWVICEWLRSLAFGAFLYGEGASIGDYWNFGSIGLAAMGTSVMYISRFVGMYGLSFIIVILSGLLYYSFLAKRFRSLGVFLLVIALLSGGAYVLYPASSRGTISASVLQLAETPVGYVEQIEILDESPDKKALIVMPEYSYIYEGTNPDIVQTYLNDRLAGGGFSITVSEGEPSERYGTLEFHDKNGLLIGTQTKQLLIPTGEYLPAIFTTFYNQTGQSKVVSGFDATRKRIKGEPPEVFKSSDTIVGPVACSGILGKNIYRDLTNQGAEVLTNSASLSTFNGSRAYFRQSLQMARFHAVANNRPFIQSTKGAPAFVLDKNGSFIIRPTGMDTKFIDFQLQTEHAKTVYTQYGDWPLFISWLWVGGIGVAALSKKRWLRLERLVAHK